MLKFGIVVATEPATARVRVSFEDHDSLVTYWLAVLQKKTLEDKDYWMPDINEHVACLMDEHFEEGVVLGAIYSSADAVPVSSMDKFHAKFKDGTVLEYDRATHKLTADIKGEIDAKTTGQAVLDSQGQVNVKSAVLVLIQAPAISFQSYTGGDSEGTLVGNIHVTGNIHADGQVSDGVRAMSADRTIYNGHSHPGASGPPDHQE